MSSAFFDRFDSALHHEWKADRALRRRVPLNQAWRGCLGLGFLLERPDDTVACGDLALVANDQLRWAVLRDVPVGHVPGSARLDARDVGWATFTRAALRFGMPALDFRADARDSFDFRRVPTAEYRHRFGSRPWDVELRRPGPDTLDCVRHPREFALLNRVSATMTRYAFCGVEHTGRPLRRPWFAARPGGLRPFVPPGLHAHMPVPYLAFPNESAGRLIAAVARGDADRMRELRGRRVREAAGLFLLPARLVAGAVRAFPPVGLWWDTAPALSACYDWETQAAALPPVRLRRWDGLQLRLPHEVALVADLVDPRFLPRGSRPRRRDIQLGAAGGQRTYALAS